MKFLDQQYQHEFLATWIYGELTTFISPSLYKKLANATISIRF